MYAIGGHRHVANAEAVGDDKSEKSENVKNETVKFQIKPVDPSPLKVPLGSRTIDTFGKPPSSVFNFENLHDHHSQWADKQRNLVAFSPFPFLAMRNLMGGPFTVHHHNPHRHHPNFHRPRHNFLPQRPRPQRRQFNF